MVGSFLKKYISLIFITIATPIICWAAAAILPTFDDWTATTSPDFSPFFIKERFLFYGYHWRPFDAITGYIVGRNPQALYPTFNHCCVVVGHCVNAILIFVVCSKLKFSPTATNVTTLFFFITPAAMATVLAVDGLNQTYSLLWGMVAFLIYISRIRAKYLLWILAIVLAAMCKENGLMWALICPVIAYGFNLTGKAAFRKDILIGVAIMGCYAIAIFILPKDITIHEEYVPTITKIANNIVKFLFTSFITVDYVWLLHQPSRNLWLAAITFLLALPFLYAIFIKNSAVYKQKKTLCLLLALLIAVTPHIGTVFSMMHTYAGLSVIALLIAVGIDQYGRHRKFYFLYFPLFILSAVIIDSHLYYTSRESGLTGKRMAQQAISKTGEPVDSAFVLIVDNGYPRLSSFCVVPSDAFGWGIAAKYETNYQWPKVTRDSTIQSAHSAHAIAEEILSSGTFDCVWIVNNTDIEVIK